MMQHPIRVLFVSDGNSARSQMAEGLLRHLGGDGFEVHSAGLDLKPLHPLAVKAMSELSIDISGQRSKHVNDYLDVQFDHVVTLCERSERFCLDFPRDRDALHWQCDDPAEAGGTEAGRLDAFRRARDEIRGQVQRWLAALKAGTQTC
jgi:arsenate reductase